MIPLKRLALAAAAALPTTALAYGTLEVPLPLGVASPEFPRAEVSNPAGLVDRGVLAFEGFYYPSLSAAPFFGSSALPALPPSSTGPVLNPGGYSISVADDAFGGFGLGMDFSGSDFGDVMTVGAAVQLGKRWRLGLAAAYDFAVPASGSPEAGYPKATSTSTAILNFGIIYGMPVDGLRVGLAFDNMSFSDFSNTNVSLGAGYLDPSLGYSLESDLVLAPFGGFSDGSGFKLAGAVYVGHLGLSFSTTYVFGATDPSLANAMEATLGVSFYFGKKVCAQLRYADADTGVGALVALTQ